jgi:hypothetical protein
VFLHSELVSFVVPARKTYLRSKSALLCIHSTANTKIFNLSKKQYEKIGILHMQTFIEESLDVIGAIMTIIFLGVSRHCKIRLGRHPRKALNHFTTSNVLLCW